MHESEKWESEVAQSCLTLSYPMDCSLPGSSIHGIFQARVLEWGVIAFSEGLLTVLFIFFSGNEERKTHSAFFFLFTATLSMNIHGWFPLELTGVLSLQSKGLSRVFSITTVWKHPFFDTQLFFYCLSLTSVHDYWKNHSFENMNLCRQSNVPVF